MSSFDFGEADAHVVLSDWEAERRPTYGGGAVRFPATREPIGRRGLNTPSARSPRFSRLQVDRDAEVAQACCTLLSLRNPPLMSARRILAHLIFSLTVHKPGSLRRCRRRC